MQGRGATRAGRRWGATVRGDGERCAPPRVLATRPATAAEVVAELRQDLPGDDGARLAYTRWAFRSLPRRAHARILDIGCGRGGPTLELAGLNAGVVIGLDIDAAAVAALARRAAERGLTHRVRLLRGSLRAMPFAPGAFDVVWAEGSAWILGFEVALEAWRQYLVPGGYLVVHEAAWLRPAPPVQAADDWHARWPGIRTVPEYLAVAVRRGYDIVAWRAVPGDVWWSSYYGPLEARIREIRPRCVGDSDGLRALAREQEDVDLFRRCAGFVGSAFLVMQRPVVRWPPSPEPTSAQAAGGGGQRGDDHA